MEFETLDARAKYQIALDVLSGKEQDYFRLSLMTPESYGGAPRLELLKAEIDDIKTRIADLKKDADAEAEKFKVTGEQIGG